MSVPVNLRYLVMAIWGLYFLACYTMSRTKTITKNTIAENLKLMSVPVILMAINALIVWLFLEGVSLRNYTRLASTCIYLFLAWGFGASGYYLFKDKVIDYLFEAGVWSYFVGSVLPLIINNGIGGIILYGRALILGEENNANYLMEVHDLTFAMGLFFLFYMFCDKRQDRNRKKKILLSVLLIFLGLKRIEILALIITVLSYYLLIRWGKSIRYRAIFLAFIFAGLSMIFIYLIDSEWLNIICSYFSINTMGRLTYYKYAAQYLEFTPLYLGKGFTYFGKVWSELYNSGYRMDEHLIAASIHSDMLVLYIENGFLFTLGWLFYSFNGKVSILRRKYSTEVAECYLLMTIYMFILYLTDNTFNYTDTQMIYFVGPLVLCYIYQNSRVEKG